MKSQSEFFYSNSRLVLREFRAGDREALMVFAHDPSQLRHMIFKLGTEEEVDNFLEYAQTTARENDRREWHLAVEEQGKPGCVGGVALMVEKDAPSSGEIGYWFKRSVWGRGYATEASRVLLGFGFEKAGLHRIYGKCHVDNRASSHVMEKLGMKLEGCIREHVWLRDHYRSSLVYSMLEPEYRGSI